VVKLLLARAGSEVLAGNIVIFWKKSAVYLTGASSGGKRNLMPTYALQWAAMRMAKDAGCETYDLYGCPPAADESHPMFGLYQFKTGFSPAVTVRWGTWDAARRACTPRTQLPNASGCGFPARAARGRRPRAELGRA
jgi:lipid II:glycine glycyltransferase (peptidoglycan interpeptide bridge formation enzyme)